MPLGHWLHPTHQLHKFVYNTTYDTIIETLKNGNLYEYARRDGITRFSQVFLFSRALHSLPENVLPTTVTRVSDDVIHGESHLELVHTIPTPIHHSWKDYLLNLPDDVRYLLTFSKICNDGKDIAYAIRTKTAIAVADASVELKTGVASIAWIISDRKETFNASGC